MALQKNHAGTTGIRVNVLKPGLKERTKGNRKQDWTAVYVNSKNLATLAALAEDDLAVITFTLRAAALLPNRNSKNFSQHCVKTAITLLSKAKAADDEAQAKLAAENNAAWGQ
jgi:hypothetical protein